MTTPSAWPLYIQQRFALGKAQSAVPSKIQAPPPDMKDDVILAKDAVEWIYSVLTTLDSKASALMRLNGVLIAAAAFILGLFGREGGTILSTTALDAVVIMSSALLSAASITLCLFVVNVSWHFLGKVRNADAAGTVVFEFREEIECLHDAMMFRQKMYRGAWRVSLVASVGFLGEFSWQTIRYVLCIL